MRKKLHLSIVLSCIALISGAAEHTEQQESGYPLIFNFTPKEYQADTQNWAVVQDERGVMYFGNNNGLLEFDGEEWRTYPMGNSSTVRTLDIAPDGSIYAGGIGELGYYLPDSKGGLSFQSLMHLVPSQTRDFSDVWQVLINDHKAYFNVDKYILIWDMRSKTFSAIRGTDRFHLLFRVGETIYVREWGTGLQVVIGDSLQLLEGGELFAEESIYVMLPLPGDDGETFIGTRTIGMFRFDGDDFKPFETEVDEYVSENLLYFPGLVLDDGHFLLGTLNDGAVVIDGKGRLVRKFDRKSGLFSPVIYSQAQDKSGGIWLATDHGISRIDYASNVSYFDARNNYSTAAYELIRFKGVLYAATSNGVYYLDPVTSNFNQLANGRNQSVALLEVDDELLVGTLDGLFRVEDKALVAVRASEGSEYDVNVILRSEADPKRVFIGAVGLWSLYKQGSEWIDEGNLLEVEDIVNSIEEDSDGTLWVGTNVSGFYRVNLVPAEGSGLANENTVITRLGSGNRPPLEGLLVKEINNEKYFLSGEDFYRYDETADRFYVDNRFKVVSSLPNYFSPFNIREDSQERLWISMGREPALGVPGSDGHYQWVKEPFKRFANEIIVSIYPDGGDIVWFSASSSIIKYDLSKVAAPKAAYPVLIRRVESGPDFSEALEPGNRDGQPLRIVYRSNSIRFSFAAPSFDDMDATRYRTFLDGHSDDWDSWEGKNTKEFTNLDPGDYTFSVVARNVFGAESTTASFAFEVLPPWYRTWFAYAAYAVIFCLGVLAVDRFQRSRLLGREREKRKVQEAEHRAEKAELEAKAAEAERKALRIEGERRSKELEEARDLQLSMLPKGRPEFGGFDLAFDMKTATEVGGDFYDYSVREDGSVNVAIGDATGHGMRAGIMVSMMKALFTADSIHMNLVDFFASANKTLKLMELKRVMMGLAMLNIDGKDVTIINAGMPPVFHLDSTDNRVTEIGLSGMPLGALGDSVYGIETLRLKIGDVLLMLSDGLPELLNEDEEMFGYDRVMAIFKDMGDRPVAEMVEGLLAAGEEWSGEREPDDDITFVALRVR